MTQPQIRIQTGTQQAPEGIYAEITKDGPIRLHGGTPIVQQFMMPDENGVSVAYQEGETYPARQVVYLCRCGQSKNKPFCDNSHKHIDKAEIDLTETADLEGEFKTALKYEGAEITLTDESKFCASARFCNAGQSIWNEVLKEGQEARELSVQIARHCPGGRLIVWDNATEQPIESFESPSVSLVEDVRAGSGGPLMLRGGIPVKSSSGEFYEVRNRQALCRCGKSGNKPFCDGTHSKQLFYDGLPGSPKSDGKIW